MSNTATVTLPAQTLTVLTKPTPLAEAIKHLDGEGYYQGVVAIPADRLLGKSENGYDDYFDTLCNALTTDSDAYSISHQILGISEDGQTFYVAVANNLVEYLRSDPVWATEQGIDLAELPF
jgi:hypothetical protein